MSEASPDRQTWTWRETLAARLQAEQTMKEDLAAWLETLSASQRKALSQLISSEDVNALQQLEALLVKRPEVI